MVPFWARCIKAGRPSSGRYGSDRLEVDRIDAVRPREMQRLEVQNQPRLGKRRTGRTLCAKPIWYLALGLEPCQMSIHDGIGGTPQPQCKSPRTDFEVGRLHAPVPAPGLHAFAPFASSSPLQCCSAFFPASLIRLSFEDPCSKSSPLTLGAKIPFCLSPPSLCV